MHANGRVFRLFISVAVLFVAGCANLDVVREFGRTAAGITAYPDAGIAFEQSARTAQPFSVLAAANSAARPDVRHAQVQRALAAQASLNAYFTMLATLAGDDGFSLTKQMDALDNGLKSLPVASGDATDIDASIALAKVVEKYLLAEKQAQAVKALVAEGGPHAMRVLDSLIRTSGDWSREVTNDERTALDSLEFLGNAKDTPPLLAMLARDRLIQLKASYDSSLQKLDLTRRALQDIRNAHEQMSETVGKLTIKQWSTLLRGAVGDLQLAKKNIELLH